MTKNHEAVFVPEHLVFKPKNVEKDIDVLMIMEVIKRSSVH